MPSHFLDIGKNRMATFLLALYMIGLYTKGYRRIFADPQIAIL